MPRHSHIQVYQVHIADGFTSDCDEIVHKCSLLKTVDFYEFSKIWKAMNFDSLYQGRVSGAEIAELSEELVHIAKHYMVKDTSYFEESITGLFLVYGLLSLQPFADFAALRLVPGDVQAIKRIEMKARQDRRLDVLYILGEVLNKWTQYHVTERARGMEMVVRKYLEGAISIDRRGLHPLGVFYRQTEEFDHIRELGSAMRQYILARKALFGDSPDISSQQYINENLATELHIGLKKLITGSATESEEKIQSDNDSSSADEKMAEDRSRTLQGIKERAMRNAVDPINHLTSAEDRKKSTKGKSDRKNQTGKKKKSTKSASASPAKGTQKQKSKGDIKNDSSDDDNIYDCDDDNGAKEKNEDDNDDADLDIEAFHQGSDLAHLGIGVYHQKCDDDDTKNSKSKKRGKKIKSEPEGGNIQFDKLPLILKPGDLGQDIEIEIIDYVNPTQNELDYKNSIETSSSEDDEPLSVKAGVSLLKTYKRERKDEQADETFYPVKKKEKREQIRREIKSKFKRLGMLPVANFVDQDKDK